MANYVGALDQGTTSNRFIIFDRNGQIVAVDQKEHEQIFPQPGWVEHNAAEIWQNTEDVIRGALEKSGLNGSDLAAIGITNQRETTVIWDRKTGKPFTNAVVWQCTRTNEICKELMRDHGQNRFRDKTGLPIATYFAGPKIKWIMDNVASARKAADKGEALFGTMETWIIWWLTGGPGSGSHVTDVTNASRTMLMNLETLDWDEEILAEFDITPDLWFFECHFEGDPVMPGCLGLDALWQLVGFHLVWQGLQGRGRLGLRGAGYRHRPLPDAARDGRPATPA